MTCDSNYTTWVKLGASITLCISTATFAAPQTVAFVETDQAMGKPPTQAYSIARAGRTIEPTAALQPCDVVTFKLDQSAIPAIRIKTIKGGKAILLDRDHPSFKVSCDPVTLSDAALRAFDAITGGQRATQPAPITGTRNTLATRNAEFHAPALMAERSNLLAGRRAIVGRELAQRPNQGDQVALGGRIELAQAGRDRFQL